MKPTTSISRRLICYLGISLPALWLLTALFSAITVFHEINEAGDTQMSQLARSLLQVPIDQEAPAQVTELHLSKQQRGLIDADEMGFIVWNTQGKMQLSDNIGQQLPYKNQYEGFINYGDWWQKHAWRAFYMHNRQTGIHVAVAASRRERLKTVRGAIWVQLGISLLSLPLLWWLILWSVRKGTAPLHSLVKELNQRQANSLEPVNDQVPKEILPVVLALNALFRRVDDTLKREQRFTADAAHELRSPLAGLKVQTEVLALSLSNHEEQYKRLCMIQDTIDRTSHLINQLLILSQMDSLTAPKYTQPIDWHSISDEVLQNVSLQAREKRIQLKRICTADWADILPLNGDEMLLVILLRNLLDNAIRYSPRHSVVTLCLTPQCIMVKDQGTGVDEASLQRLHERFFRPAGQTEKGSGLGLSIVDSIAHLHGLQVHYQNQQNQQGQTEGFKVVVDKVKD
ncbi:ATP-binding protein [Neisseriaceae bacterium ESL0693]|nr:ATP-binding protein [Neisseriaceae bacterium ESL0693]